MTIGDRCCAGSSAEAAGADDEETEVKTGTDGDAVEDEDGSVERREVGIL
jgi:hypothetical protein